MSEDVDIHENDSLTISIPVIDKTTGGVKDLTGAVITAIVVDIHGNTTTVDTITNAAPTTGVFEVEVAKNKLKTGPRKVQARINIGAESQVTVDHPITVLPAYL